MVQICIYFISAFSIIAKSWKQVGFYLRLLIHVWWGGVLTWYKHKIFFQKIVKKLVSVSVSKEQNPRRMRSFVFHHVPSVQLEFAICPKTHTFKCDFCTTCKDFLIDRFIFMKSLINPGDWFLVQTDEWLLFSSLTWGGGTQHLSV